MDKEKLIPIIIQTVQDAVRKDKLGNSKVSLAKQDTFLIFYSKIEFFYSDFKEWLLKNLRILTDKK